MPTTKSKQKFLIYRGWCVMTFFGRYLKYTDPNGFFYIHSEGRKEASDPCIFIISCFLIDCGDNIMRFNLSVFIVFAKMSIVLYFHLVFISSEKDLLCAFSLVNVQLLADSTNQDNFSYIHDFFWHLSHVSSTFFFTIHQFITRLHKTYHRSTVSPYH